MLPTLRHDHKVGAPPQRRMVGHRPAAIIPSGRAGAVYMRAAGTETSSRSGHRSAVSLPPKQQPVSMQMVLFCHCASASGVWPWIMAALPR